MSTRPAACQPGSVRDGSPGTSGRRTAALPVVAAVALLALALVPAAAASVGAAGGPDRADAAAVAGSQSAAERADGEIEHAAYVGLGLVRDDGNATYLFDDEPHELVVAYRTDVDAVLAGVCVRIAPRGEPAGGEGNRTGNETRLCDVDAETAVRNDTAATKRLSFAEWPVDWTGAATVTVELVVERDGTTVVVDSRELAVRAVAPDGDRSDNGLTNAEELRHGTDPVARDTDGNGVPDAVEVLLGTDPTNPYTPHAFVVGFAALVGVLVGGAALYVTPEGDGESGTDGAADADAGSGAAAGSASGAAAAGDAFEGAADVLTDRERVRRLIEANGGRVRQQSIVEGTDWSKSKVSRVLSRMEEDGGVSRTRIGRENVVTLDGDAEPNGGDGPTDGGPEGEDG